MNAKIVGGGLILATGLVAAIFWLQGSNQAENVTGIGPAELKPTDSVVTQIQPTEVKPGRFYDYHVANSPLAGEVRDLISVPLVAEYKSEAIHILLRDIEWSEGKAVLLLRSGIYWSDGKPFVAQHISDAFNRFLRLTGVSTFAKTEDIDQWRGLTMVVEGSERVVIRGFSSPEILVKLLASHYLRPYRGALGEGDKDLDKAFLASLGPYRVSEVPVETLAVPGALRLLPNDVYYKGPKLEPLDIDLAPFF